MRVLEAEDANGFETERLNAAVNTRATERFAGVDVTGYTQIKAELGDKAEPMSRVVLQTLHRLNNEHNTFTGAVGARHGA